MNWKFFQWQSLKTRVTLFTLAIFVIGIWSLTLYASRMLREDLQRLSGEQQFATVSLIAAGINDELSDRWIVLEKVAERITPAILGNAAAIQAFLEDHPGIQSLFNGGVIAYQLDGVAIAEVPLSAGRIGVNYMDVDTIAAALKEGRSTIGRPVVGRKLLAPVFGMTVPVRDARGKVIGALAGVTNLGAPNFLDKIAQSRYDKSGGHLMLVASQYRLIVTASDKSRIMQALPAPGINSLIDRFNQGYEGSGLTVSPPEVEVLASAKGVPVAAWYAVIVLPTAEAFAPIHAMQQRMLLAAIFVTLLAGALTWWMLRRQLLPLLAAAAALATRSDTDRAPQRLPIARQDEIGQLIGHFNRLLAILEQREEALKESEGRFRTLIDWSIEAIAVHRGGKLLYVNPAAITMIGARSVQELVGKPILEWVHPDYRQIVLARVKSVTDTGLATPLIEEKFLKLDGAVIDVEVQSTSIVYDGAPAIQVGMRDITERKRAEDALRQREERYRLLAEASHDMIVLVNRRREVEYVNTFAARQFASSPEKLIGRRLSDIFPPETAARHGTNLQKVFTSGESLYVEAPSAFPGTSLWLGSWLVPIKEPAGEITAILVVSRDITERKRAEQALAESEARFRSLTELSSDFFWETDIEHRITQRAESYNRTRESVFHHGSPIGRRRWEIPYLSPDESAWQVHRALLDAHLPFREFVFSRLAADATERHVSISGYPVFDAADHFQGYRGVGSDITERKRMEEQVRQMAFHDTLTKLPNRRLLNDRLSQAIAASKRSGLFGALMFLDLDNFKALNDAHGHEVGDLLLIEAADRLKCCVREMDTVARFGGDEFVVMIGELDADESGSTAQAGVIAEKVRAALANAYLLKVRRDGKAETTVEHRCTVSLGVALFGKHEASRGDILKRADAAMYQAKEAGRNMIRFHDSIS